MSASLPPAPEFDDSPGRAVAPGGHAGYRTVAALGMAWVLMQTAFSKGLSFIAQLVLGWLLSKEDYALYAIAVSISALVGALRNGGMQKVLVQRGTGAGAGAGAAGDAGGDAVGDAARTAGSAYDRWAGAVLQVSLLFNLVCAGLLVLAAPLAADFYDAPDLPPLLWITAGAIVLATPAMILQARILTNLDFATNARITSLSAAAYYGSMIAFAALGFGPLSFVLPQVVVAVFDAVAFGIAARSLPQVRRISAAQLRTLLGASGWVMLSALAVTLINQGDFLVVGRLQPTLLGEYFFGVMLAAAIASVFGIGLSSVLMPTLSQLKEQPQRFSRAYLQSIRMFVLLFAPVCIAAAGLASPLVHAMWDGKWDQAIGVVEAFTLSLLFRMLTPIALAALEARAQWRRSATLLLIDGVGTLAAATIGCLIGDLSSIVWCMCGNRVAMALLQCSVVARLNGLPLAAVARAIAPPAVVAALAGAIGFAGALGVDAVTSSDGRWPRALVFALAFSVAYAALCRLLLPVRTAEAIDTFRTLRNVARSRPAS